jgi:hypothetical protein
MPGSVSAELAEFLMQTGQLLLACQSRFGIPNGVPLRVIVDDRARTVSIEAQHEMMWTPVVAIEANPQSPTFGQAVTGEGRAVP